MSAPSAFCSKCGKELFGENFCPVCGTPNASKSVNDIPSIPASPSPNDFGGRGNNDNSSSPNRNKKFVYTGIAIGAVFALIVGSIGVNYYALSNLQFRGSGTENFDFATLGVDMKMDVCNPTPIPTNFDKFTLVVNYKDREFATMTMKGKNIPSYQTTTVDGRLSINAQTFTGLFIQALADGFAGKESSFDENDLSFVTTIDTKALGLIPLSNSRTFTMSEFQEVMQHRNSGQFSCT